MALLSVNAFRYFLEISFMGLDYRGWQVQKGAPSIQQTIEDALQILLREQVTLTGAGRTDTGVHALNYTAHFDCKISPEAVEQTKLNYRLNQLLPSSISIQKILHVRPDAHARFSAISRSYKYLICRQKDPFWHQRAWQIGSALNVDCMQKAANILHQYNDFKCFAKSNTQVKDFLCEISEASFKENDYILVFEITANRFLRNMVRAIMGTLVKVGLGKLNLIDFAEIIESRDRSKAGYSAPGYGLYFAGAKYDDSIFMPPYLESAFE